MSAKSDIITSAEAAEMLGVSPSTLATYRYRGTSPKYTKVGYRTVVYSRRDVERYIKARDAAKNWREKTR
ncbi:helix-turn-helix transcriptional regulator [Mycobacteroides abscessus]|uniref:helix-turn-helix transcriptional regulator n=1 Tax=Mycobacteroides abscessus TaxID=36809 RepID=UPI000927BC92|nr:helix-turn-helix domain-containing protein [Mycobacteroides abscessus]SHP98040.1 Predicted transcriptional regulator [Mycobacteroides abscessus subsp. abscessus]SHQ60622.1 Predicted transcriptional regulator [Mycobacteroides abscessus subsp. abscessus]SKD63975.1 Predicted transcriptional regulator [Mycobacteroides abscessus subsp. abscessus]SLD62850.1 Predicted transcriptional regulator [Mycobacteroides abscessus subsp. abscessus]